MSKIVEKKNKKDSERFNQARRVARLLLFMQGVGKATMDEIVGYMQSGIGDKAPAERTIRHDVRVLVEEGFVEISKSLDKRFNEYCYVQTVAQSGISKDNQAAFRIKEALPYHLVKPYFDKVNGTSLENPGESLKKRIESLIPGDINLDEIIYVDQNPGAYDYSIKPKVLEFLIIRINNKEWINIQYQKVFSGEIGHAEIFPQCLYIYDGIIYLIAYNPKTKKNQSYAIHNILDFKESGDQNKPHPGFDFKQFREERFAVYDGTVKQVRLTIRREFSIYFENRKWHPTAKTKPGKNGALIVEMNVPDGQDFISWLVRWSEAIIGIEPVDLKKKVIERLESALINLENRNI